MRANTMTLALCALWMGAGVFGCEAQAAEQSARHPPVKTPRPTPRVDAPEADAPQAPKPPTPHVQARPLSVVTIEDGAGPLEEQIGVQVRRAKRRGQSVFLEMGAPWCGPCKRVKALLAEKDGIRTQLDGVVLLRVNSDIFGAELDALGFSDQTIPTFYKLDESGARTENVAHGHSWKNRASVAEKLVAFLRSE